MTGMNKSIPARWIPFALAVPISSLGSSRTASSDHYSYSRSGRPGSPTEGTHSKAK